MLPYRGGAVVKNDLYNRHEVGRVTFLKIQIRSLLKPIEFSLHHALQSTHSVT